MAKSMVGTCRCEKPAEWSDVTGVTSREAQARARWAPDLETRAHEEAANTIHTHPSSHSLFHHFVNTIKTIRVKMKRLKV